MASRVDRKSAAGDQKNGSRATLFTLPDEILCLIFRFLDVADYSSFYGAILNPGSKLMLIKQLARIWKAKLGTLHYLKDQLQAGRDGFLFETEIVFPLHFMACIATLRSNLELADEHQEKIKNILIQAVRDADGQIADSWIDMEMEWNLWESPIER